ncbi:hypothetical protein GH714_007722 [Hevea brasiliensis]|uniref:Uncharacterized protein n=1 Tax=Hevea brasiliensis TaxID=3981 RepID=A0A6A6L9X4_HEVBR|nr:hypothetical protein GH714_007722 [Hevea brasiliensis]
MMSYMRAEMSMVIPLLMLHSYTPTVPVVPFQLSTDLGVFMAQVVTAAITANPRDSWEVVERARHLEAYDFDGSSNADVAKKWLRMIIKFRGSNFRELVEAALNVEKVKQEEKEYEQKLSKKHGQGSSQGFRERSAKRGGSSFQPREEFSGSGRGSYLSTGQQITRPQASQRSVVQPMGGSFGAQK